MDYFKKFASYMNECFPSYLKAYSDDYVSKEEYIKLVKEVKRLRYKVCKLEKLYYIKKEKKNE